MSIRFACPTCGKKLKAGDAQAGQKAKCSGCGTITAVPRAEGTAAPGDDQLDEAPLVVRRKSEEEDPVDLTAMVDIVFFLLIFFMVTSIQALQAALEIPAPDPQENAVGRTVDEIEQDADLIVVRVEADGSVFVDDIEAPTRQELIAQIRRVREEEFDENAGLIVMASGDARHETVVMALDAAAAAGMNSVRLATIEEDEF